MTLYFSAGGADIELSDEELESALFDSYRQLGVRSKVMVVPPDYTRSSSRAGLLTSLTEAFYGSNLKIVLPALGTHKPMTADQINRMYPGVPHTKFRDHRWRSDVVTVGEVPANFVADVTQGIWKKPWPAQMNRLIWEGGHDLVVSVGQVVPHEVMGMANYNKNIFIGTGGAESINTSHFIGAAWGIERTLGVTDTPLRRILNCAQDMFCRNLPLLYVLTVVGSRDTGELVTRGLFIGDDPECFERAAELSARVNFTALDQRLNKIVVYLSPDEFNSTWLGNKAIYRTRLAIADGGELVILGPGIDSFGEDKDIDTLIRKYGYRTTPVVMAKLEANADLSANLSAAAHLIHGSTEGRFTVTYCTGGLSRAEIESVGFGYGDNTTLMRRYRPETRASGWQETADGERYYYIDNPALGLWAARDAGSG